MDVSFNREMISQLKLDTPFTVEAVEKLQRYFDFFVKNL